MERGEGGLWKEGEGTEEGRGGREVLRLLSMKFVCIFNRLFIDLLICHLSVLVCTPFLL